MGQTNNSNTTCAGGDFLTRRIGAVSTSPEDLRLRRRGRDAASSKARLDPLLQRRGPGTNAVASPDRSNIFDCRRRGCSGRVSKSAAGTTSRPGGLSRASLGLRLGLGRFDRLGLGRWWVQLQRALVELAQTPLLSCRLPAAASCG